MRHQPRYVGQHDITRGCLPMMTCMFLFFIASLLPASQGRDLEWWDLLSTWDRCSTGILCCKSCLTQILPLALWRGWTCGSAGPVIYASVINSTIHSSTHSLFLSLASRSTHPSTQFLNHPFIHWTHSLSGKWISTPRKMWQTTSWHKNWEGVIFKASAKSPS